MNKNKKLWSSMVSVAMAVSTIAMPAANVMAAPTTNFNYAEALQKGILFYDFQKTGVLPEDIRTNWRGDSFVDDGKEYGVDLSGGFMDAGDNMKFNLPMAYTSTILAWSYLDDKDVYEKSGQAKYMLDNIKYVNDYFINCHPTADEYYYQVGDIDSDHSFWGAAEVANQKTTRNCYKVTLDNPGSCVEGGTAASLAACALVFKDSDPAYSAECIKHAKELYSLAERSKGDEGYNKTVGSCYHSWSGFYDELTWAGVWIYLATGDEEYLDKAEDYVNEWGTEGQENSLEYKWAMSWDNVHLGATLLLDRITGKPLYDDLIQKHLDYWTTGLDNGKGARADYLKDGLAVGCDSWGTLRYACNTAFLAATYAKEDNCPDDKAKTYMDFAKSQADYTLGSTGRSFVCGFGENSPQNPHHRTAHGSWVNQVGGAPEKFRHTLVGALVGGPDKSGKYIDEPTDFTTNEVACDYNAGFVGLMAKMYDNYGGTLLPDSEVNGFETPANDELFIEGGINGKDVTSPKNYIEFKFMLRNHTAWPARLTDKLKYRVFLDLTDVIKNGYTADDMAVRAGYAQYKGTKVSKVLPWDEANNIYYVEVDLTGADIYPGGQSEHRNEVQLRIEAPCKWDFTNSPSYIGLESAGPNSAILAENVALYDDGVLAFGNEPGAPKKAPVVTLTSPADKTAYDFSDGNVEAIKLNANATVEDGTVDSITFYVNGKEYKTVKGEEAVAELTLPEFSTAKDGIEKYTIKAVATANGKTAEKTATITVKLPVKEAPVVKVECSKDGKDVIVKADATVKGSTIKEIEIFVNGESIGKGAEATFTPSGYADKEGVPTKFVVTAKATAENGTTATSEPVVVEVQLPAKPAPTVAVVTPEAGQEFTDETTKVTVSATADIAEGSVSKVVFYADGKEFATATKAVDGVYTATYNVEGTVPEMGMLTPVTFTVKAISDLGATTTSEAVKVNIQKVVKELPPVNFNLAVSNNVNGTANSNTITNNFVVKHESGDDVDLSKLSLRYFFTKEGATNQTVWIDNAAAQMNFAPWYVSYTGEAKGKVVAMAAPTADADSYIEITFGGNDVLKAGAQLSIATRTAKADWSNYDQTNDFSYGDSDKIAVYYDGELIAGMEP